MDRLTETTDALEQTTTYEYDDAGNLVTLTDAEGRTAQSVYDSRDRLTEIIDPLGNSTQYEYDADDNLVAEVDPLGNRTEYQYDARSRLVGETDAEDNVTRFEYDVNDNLTATVDANQHRTEYQYDQLDRSVKQIDADGGEFTTEYDEVGNVVATIDELGRRTELAYDSLNRLTSTTDAELGVVAYEYDPVGNITSITDEESRTTRMGYDALNRTTEIIDPLTNSTSYTYDPVGNLTSVTDANEHTTSYSYDKLNRQTVVTNSVGDTIQTEYDKVDNVTAITDELDRTTTFAYDERDLQTGVTDPEGNTTTTEYDAVGNPIAEVDPLENRTNYAYDNIYRLIATTDAENRTTNYTYDPVGNLASISDPEENTTAYTYDELDRLVTDTNQLGFTRTYTYDAIGNLIESRDRNDRVIQYQYDRLNRNTAEIWLDENNNPVHTFDYDYDASSLLTNAEDSVSSYEYDYDLASRLTSVDNAGTPLVPNVVFNYDYDPAGNLIRVSDTIDGVAKGVENFTYDALDRVTSITQSGNEIADKRIDYTYDKASQRIKSDRYNSLDGNNPLATTNYDYDRNGRVTDITHLTGNDTIAAYDYKYDANNRITEFATPEGVSIYNYDKTDQLSSAEHTHQSNEAYSYDDNGNRVGDGYSTGENNQLLTDGTYNYEYDGEGNRTSQTEIATGIVTEYFWDYRNRLTAVVTFDSNGNVTERNEYTYDVNDNRIAKSVDADGDGAGVAFVERYVLDGSEIALVFDSEGNETERYFHGVGIDEVLAVEKADSEVIWALADHQGTVRVLMDNSGNVVNQISYDAFGNVTAQTNAGESFRFGYTGRELDPETGLYYYRARYYDSETGLFISQDPIGFEGGDSNLYRYVNNSPVIYTDPYGEAVTIPFLIGVAVITLLADGISPDGAHTPTMPTDRNGNRLTSEDLSNPGACDDSPIYDNPQDLDRSLQRAGTEVVLGGLPSLGKGLIKNAPQLLRSLSDDAINALDNILPKDLGSIPVPVEGAFDDLAKQADKFDDLITDGLRGLDDAATGLGAAADDLFKPFFESSKQGGKFTEPTLPPKKVAEKGEIKITHNYRSDDHAPAHVHITGGGKTTRIKENLQPMPGDPAPTAKQQEVIDANKGKIKRTLKKIIKWIEYDELPE